MKIIELSKSYVNKFYDGNFGKAIAEQDGIVYDDKKIKLAFNFGNGTFKDFNRYMKANTKVCKFYDLENNCYMY